MNSRGDDPDRRRAARTGRALLRRGLQPGLHAWIEALARAHEDPDRVFAWGGALAAIALELERAYGRAGSEVRDLILQLHRAIDATGAPPSLFAYPELADFLPWITGLPASGPDRAWLQTRRTLLSWIDVASERLTMRRYHRPDHPLHHARALIVQPLVQLGLDPGGEGATAHHGAEAWDPFALTLLRFLDLLDSERQGALGRNRVAGSLPAQMGGFYGVSENVQPPERNAVDQLTRELLQAVGSLAAAPLPSPLVGVILKDMNAALETRLRRGDWPQAFRPLSPEQRRRPPSMWRRLLALGGRG